MQVAGQPVGSRRPCSRSTCGRTCCRTTPATGGRPASTTDRHRATRRHRVRAAARHAVPAGDASIQRARSRSRPASNPPVFAQPTGVDGLHRATRLEPAGPAARRQQDHHGRQRTPSRHPARARRVAQLDARRRRRPGAAPWLTLPADHRPTSQPGQPAHRQRDDAVPAALAHQRLLHQPGQRLRLQPATRRRRLRQRAGRLPDEQGGYCQQYAAAMGVMLRLAGVPSRVVLGYTHPLPDASGKFTVTTTTRTPGSRRTSPASAGCPFDPTPLAGIAGGAANDLPWAPHADSPAAPDRAAPTMRRGAPTVQARTAVDGTDPHASAAAVDAPAAASRVAVAHRRWCRACSSLLLRCCAAGCRALATAPTSAATRPGRRHRRAVGRTVRHRDRSGLRLVAGAHAAPGRSSWLGRPRRRRDERVAARWPRRSSARATHRRRAHADGAALVGDLDAVEDQRRCGCGQRGSLASATAARPAAGVARTGAAFAGINDGCRGTANGASTALTRERAGRGQRATRPVRSVLVEAAAQPVFHARAQAARSGRCARTAPARRRWLELPRLRSDCTP